MIYFHSNTNKNRVSESENVYVAIGETKLMFN